MMRAIIFDCFGVLVGQGFDTTYRLAGGDPVRDRGFVSDLLGAANLGLITSTQMTEQVCHKLNIEPRAWHLAVSASEMPDQELLDYTESLKPKYKIAILSNANTGTLDRKFTKEQLAIFDAVVVSAEVGHIKPDSAIYQLVARRLGVSADECVFTDDSEGYCQGARDAGMQAIRYENFSQFVGQLEAILDHK